MIRNKYEESKFDPQLRTITPYTIKFKRRDLPDGLLDISNHHCEIVSVINSNIYILFIIYLCTKPINSIVQYNIHTLERMIGRFFDASRDKCNAG